MTTNTNDINAAAERLRRAKNPGEKPYWDIVKPPGDAASMHYAKIDDLKLIANAYLAEHDPTSDRPKELKCIFCDFHADSLDSLKKHSAECREHPLYQFKLAYNQWAEKTEWVQDKSDWEFPALGLHRADVMRLEIERLTKQLQEACGLLTRYPKGEFMPWNTESRLFVERAFPTKGEK